MWLLASTRAASQTILELSLTDGSRCVRGGCWQISHSRSDYIDRAEERPMGNVSAGLRADTRWKPFRKLPIKKEQPSWGDLAVCISLRNSRPLTLCLSSQLLTESPAQTCVKMLVSEDLHCNVRYGVQKTCIITHSPTVKDSLPVQRTARPQWWARVFNFTR